MILGIALLLNPAGPNASELRGYLDDVSATQCHLDRSHSDFVPVYSTARQPSRTRRHVRS